MRLPEDFIENSLDSVSQGAVVEEHQGICPDGWHIPRQEEWVRLGQFAINKRKGLAAALKSREGWAQGDMTKNNNDSLRCVKNKVPPKDAAPENAIQSQQQ